MRKCQLPAVRDVILSTAQFFLFLVFLTLFSMEAEAEEYTYYAKYCAKVSTNSIGRGLVYVTTKNDYYGSYESPENTNYKISMETTCATNSKGKTALITIYAYCRAFDGYKITGWGNADNTVDIPVGKSGDEAVFYYNVETSMGGTDKVWQCACNIISSSTDKNNAPSSTVYANLVPIDYTIVFHSNNGADQTTSQAFKYDEEKALTANSFSFSDFEFIGWSKSSGAQDIVYTNNQPVSKLTTTDGDQIHLYAQWRHIHDKGLPTEIQFAPWLETTSLPTNGSWALVNNVVIDSLNIRNGEHLDLCLLGKTAQTKSYIAVVREAEFNLYDCEGNTGVLEVIADELTGKTRSKNVLFVNEGGVFNMYGGHIKNDLTLKPEIVPTIAIKSQNGKNGVANIYGGIIDRNERMCFGLDGKAQLNIYGGEIKDTYSDRDWGSSAAIWCCPDNNNGHTAFNGSVYIYGGKVSQANSTAHTFAINNQSLEKIGDNYAGGYIYYLAPAQVTDYALARTVVGSTSTPSVNAGMIAGPNLTLSQGYYTAEFVGTKLGGANYDVIQTGTTTRTFTLNTIPRSDDLVYFFTIPNEDWAIKDPKNTGLAESNENVIARLQTAADGASCTKVEIVRLYTYTYTLDKQGGSDGGDYAYYSVDNLNNGFFADPACLEYTLDIPTLEYYDFAGYFTQKDGKGDKIFDENGVSLYQGKRQVWNPVDNFVLYAYWTPKKYNLKWNTNGGTIVSEEGEYTPEGLVAHGTIIVPPTVDKSCAIFNGWLPANAEWKMPIEDVTYSAQWKEEFFIFDNNTEDGKWETPENWLYGDEGDPVRSTSNLPSKYSQVFIMANCVLSTEQHVGGIFVESEVNLTITPEGGLTIDECGMEGLTVDNFTLQSDATHGTGYVRMHPTYSEEKIPSATVQMYSKAYFVADDDDPNATATWQYIGTAVQTDEILGNLFYGDALEEWNETIGNWDYCGNYDKMGIFKGYAYSQYKDENGKIQTYQGDLVSGNKTITLALEGSKFDFTEDERKIYEISASLGKGGFNLLANSFSAPIDATQFDLENDFSGDVDKTLYVYNTGSFNSWKSQIGGGKQTQFGVSVGQYINIPLGAVKHMDNPLLDVIPSMQAFFIQALKPNATISFNYERLIWNGDYVKHSNKPMRVAARNQANADNGLSARIQITVTGSGQTDKIYLFEGDDFSAEYDNGYDSRKLLGSKDVPQLYVKTADNKFAFFASDDINNSYIGLRTALSDSIINYTFTFDGIIGDDYELYDSQLGIATPIYNGNSYNFYAEGGIKIEQRFVIRKKPSANTNIDNLYDNGNSNRLLRHEGDFVKAVDNSGEAQTLEIFDAQGRLILSSNYTNSVRLDISTLPAGTYVARTANEVLKLIK